MGGQFDWVLVGYHCYRVAVLAAVAAVATVAAVAVAATRRTKFGWELRTSAESEQDGFSG